MSCGARVVVPFLGALAAVLAVSGCARQIVRLYEGPERPGSQIAILFNWGGVRVEGVDDEYDVDPAPQVHLLPGCRIIRVRFDREIRAEDEPTRRQRERYRAPSAGDAEARDRVRGHSEQPTNIGVVERSGDVGRARYSMNASFAVELKAAHFYEIVATFTGDEFVPRLVEFGSTGERLFAYSAAHWSVRDCTQSRQERAATGG